jgi:hypothetical protein
MVANVRAGLFKKLQVKPGMRIAVLHAPPEFEKLLTKLPDGVERTKSVRGELDLIHTFATEKHAAIGEAPKLAKALRAGGILWVSYPKGKKIATDLNRDVLRVELEQLGLGLEAVAQVAIDELWSALRFKRVEAAKGR